MDYAKSAGVDLKRQKTGGLAGGPPSGPILLEQVAGPNRGLAATSLAAIAALSSLIAPPARAQSADDFARLVAAYPTFLDRIDGNFLVWKDGKTRTAIDDGKGAKDHEARLATSDIKDMFTQRYVAGKPDAPPALNVDPGRARNAALFDTMYGDCMKGGVAGNLVEVVWLPKKWGQTLKVTRINGVAEKLKMVSAELDELPTDKDVFLKPPAGTYNCRPIAGTNRVSAHGHGIAVDIAIGRAHYWRWDGGKPGAVKSYRNSIPFEIVEIFERHGFIWGGKWYHYDTMHFEYRPELLPAK